MLSGKNINVSTYFHVVGVDVVRTRQLHTTSGGGLYKASIECSNPLRAIPGLKKKLRTSARELKAG